jgi:peptidoglycan/xylan/chitin deacetylase (PgdA/CDA1 family)
LAAVWFAVSTATSAHGPVPVEKAVTATEDSVPFAPQIPILLYHSIADRTGDPYAVSPARFAAEMAHLRKAGYHPLHFAELTGWPAGLPLPAKPIVITLDDGYEDNYTEAYPVLQKNGLKAVIFAITGFVSKEDRLTWSQMRDMQDSGLIEIGSHTVTHPNLTKLPPDERTREVTDSKAELERQLKVPVRAFAYPYGFYDRETTEAVRKAGYLFAVTGEHGPADVRQGLLTLHRIAITGDVKLAEFAARFP